MNATPDKYSLTETFREKPLGFEDEYYKHEGRRTIEDRENDDLYDDYGDGRDYGLE